MLVIAIVIGCTTTRNTLVMDFSEDLLHAVEGDMKSEIYKLMKALNVPSPSDISTTTLNKLNKVARFPVKVLDKNLDLCKSAAPTWGGGPRP